MTPIDDFKQTGNASILVVRKHSNDKYTSAAFFWEPYGEGLLETYHEFRLEKDEQWVFEEDFCENEEAVETDYATVHSFMYQAVRAELDYDSECMDERETFKIDKFILAPEEDVQPIDLDIDFTALAKKFDKNHLGNKWYTPSEMRALSNDDAPYSYKKPEYNANPKYHHPEVIEELYNRNYSSRIPREVIDRILSLPHEELREDFEALLYSAMALGSGIDNWPKEKLKDEFYIQVCAAMQFLGAIGDARSLPVLLEFLKQEGEFCDFFFADFPYEIAVAPIALCFHEQYQVLEDFLKEKGIYQLNKMDIAEMLSDEIASTVKDTASIKQVFGNMLKFILENGERWEYYNRAVVASICGACVEVRAEELLPLIKEIYDKNLADKSVIGNYEDICEYMQPPINGPKVSRIKDIYEYYNCKSKSDETSGSAETSKRQKEAAP